MCSPAASCAAHIASCIKSACQRLPSARYSTSAMLSTIIHGSSRFPPLVVNPPHPADVRVNIRLLRHRRNWQAVGRNLQVTEEKIVDLMFCCSSPHSGKNSTGRLSSSFTHLPSFRDDNAVPDIGNGPIQFCTLRVMLCAAGSVQFFLPNIRSFNLHERFCPPFFHARLPLGK